MLSQGTGDYCSSLRPGVDTVIKKEKVQHNVLSIEGKTMGVKCRTGESREITVTFMSGKRG